MSLESALEEERLEILKLLERPRKASPSPSGAYSTPSSPRQRYTSLTGGSRTSSPNRGGSTPLVPSLIDAVASAPYGSAATETASPEAISPASPSPTTSTVNGVHRSRSDASANAPPFSSMGRGLTPNEAYNFNPLPSVPVSALPLRVSNPKLHEPQPGGSWKRSKSPLYGRSASPRSSTGRVASPPPTQLSPLIEPPVVDIIDLEHAYARLNDAAMASSGGVLGSLPERRTVVTEDGEHVRAGSGETLTVDGGVRLQKDIHLGGETAVVDTSEDESSDQDSNSISDADERRGRLGRRSTSSLIRVAESESRENSSERDVEPLRTMVGIDPGGGKKKHRGSKGVDATKGSKFTQKKRVTRSLLAAAEEERKLVSSKAKYKVRSLLPSISITSTGSAGLPGATSPTTVRRSGVHPTTNFDDDSKNATPVSSDVEADDRDLHQAQRLQLSASPILSSPETQRVVRTILRGDYDRLAREISRGERRARKYLVATDLSHEAQYAMEWTIGTVLRDGDTLLAICAVDQETVGDGGEIVTESSINEAMQEVSKQATLVGTVSPLPDGGNTPGTSSPLAQDGERTGTRTKSERERYVSAEAITSQITKLLRKTKLQIKIVIEVIHCKSPKHLLTEIIDLVEPTLVVLGSRGRSALKGVLLGSFSNYLVTKSSVPVMVARKKLKHTKKYANPNVRLSNNLQSNKMRILQNAKVD